MVEHPLSEMNIRSLRPWGRRAFALGLGLTLAPLAYSLGFGEPELLSRLAQPLQVRVPLVLDTPSDAKGIQVKLSDSEVYKAFRLTPPVELLRQARATVREVDGRPYVYIESDQRNLEPYLGLLLEAQIEGVRVVREVSVLSDPVEPRPQVQWYAPPAAQTEPTGSGVQLSTRDAQLLQTLLQEARARQAGSRASAPSAAVAPAASIAPVPAQAEALAAVESAPAIPDSVAARSAPGTYGPIRPGQSISKIAQIVRTDPSINLPRMIAALVLANPQAFPDGPDSMLVGSVLNIPDMDSARRLRWNEVLSIVDRGPRAAPSAETATGAAESPAPVEPETTTASVADPAPAAEALQLVDQLQAPATPAVTAGLMLQLVESLAEIPVVAATPPPAATEVAAEPMVDVDTTTTEVAAIAAEPAAPAATAPADTGTPFWVWAAAALILVGLIYGVKSVQQRRADAASVVTETGNTIEPEAEPAADEASLDPTAEDPFAPAPAPAAAAAEPPASIRLVRPVLDAPATNLQGRLAQLQRQAVDDAHKRKLSVAEAFLEGGETQDAKELMDEVEALMVLKSGDASRLRIS